LASDSSIHFRSSSGTACPSLIHDCAQQALATMRIIRSCLRWISSTMSRNRFDPCAMIPQRFSHESRTAGGSFFTARHSFRSCLTSAPAEKPIPHPRKNPPALQIEQMNCPLPVRELSLAVTGFTTRIERAYNIGMIIRARTRHGGSHGHEWLKSEARRTEGKT
jgi:hypothetical protein